MTAAAVEELDLDRFGGVVSLQPLPGGWTLYRLAGWHERDELGLARIVGVVARQRHLEDRHGAGVVNVEEEVAPALGVPSRLKPGAHLDRLGSLLLLVAELFSLVLLAQQHHADGEGSNRADSGEHIWRRRRSRWDRP